MDVTSLYDRRPDKRWNRLCVGDIFERVAFATPDKEALVGAFGAYSSPLFHRLTYAGADMLANRLAHAFHRRGIVRGDRVFFICENSVEALLSKIALAKLGAVAVPINPNHNGDVLLHQYKLTEPKLVIADAEHGALPAGAGIRVDITIPLGEQTGEASTLIEDFIAGQPDETPDATVHGDDIWQIIFTSGTTAMPKGVMLSHSYAYLVAMSYALPFTRGLAHESHLRMVCFTPILYHVGDQAYTMPALMTGGTIILGRRYRPDQIAATIEAEQATAVIGSGLPLLSRLVPELEARGPGAMASLTCIVYGMGVIPPALHDRLKALAPNLTATLVAGQTECVSGHRFMPRVFTDKHAEALERGANLIGLPNALLASRVADLNDGTLLTTSGHMGELVYRSPAIMAGYYRDADATEKAFAGGWFHSGDVGSGDPDGFRFIDGRIKDLIKTGGENVSSMRVEAVLRSYPGVVQGVAIGLPDAIWGEAVVGILAGGPGVELIPAQVIAFCRARLAGYETPKRIIVMKELPIDFSGKVRKFVLKEKLLALEKQAAS